jgi:hypothetical protein
MDSQAEAQRRYSLLAPDRRRHLQQLSEGAAAFPEMTKRLQQVADFVDAEEAGFDLPNEYLRVVHSDPMIAALKTMQISGPAHDPERLLFGTLLSDEVMAEMSPLSDGSGLVLISDALMSLCIHMSQVNALWLGSAAEKRGLLGMVKLANAARKGASSSRSLVAGALLRSHLVHQRLYGLPAKLTPLLSESGLRISEVVTMCALQFICAHEASHFALGHSTDPVGLLSAENLSLIENSEELEFESDRVAANAMVIAHQGEGGRGAPIISAGVMLALEAIALMEHATFVRRVRTHPPASARWRRLEGVLPAGAAGNLLFGMKQAITVGGDPEVPLPATAWNLMASSPEVFRENHDDDYLNAHRDIDVMLTWPVEKLIYGLSRVEPSGPILDEGLNEARKGDLASALHIWGVPTHRAERLLDRRYSLGFYTTVDALRHSEAIMQLSTSTSRRVVAASLATILSRERRW